MGSPAVTSRWADAAFHPIELRTRDVRRQRGSPQSPPVIWTKTNEVIHRSAATGRHSAVRGYGDAYHTESRDMRLLPSLLSATPAEVATFRSQLWDRYTVPPDTPPDKAETAFERLAALIISYLNSPIPNAPDPPCYVGPCITCGAEDCLPIAQPWAVPLI